MSADMQRRLDEAMAKVAALAEAMGVTAGDLLGFVACLRVWTAKGETFEQAIRSNLSTWQMLLDNASDGRQRDLSLHRRGFDALVTWTIDAVHPTGVA